MKSPILKTEDLRMVFRAGHLEVHALRGVDIEVDHGEFVASMGPSGAGKATLVPLLGGLARPTSGRIFVDGVEMSVASDTERTRTRREKIGFVFQRFNLLPTLTVRGNLEIARQIQGEKPPPRERVVELLEMVGLPHKSQMKPLELSAGEQQRIAIARALANDPPLLLADEPTGNRDSESGGLILDLFKGLKRGLGQPILMITHSPEAAAGPHRRIEMRDGRVMSPGAFPQVATGAAT